MPNNSGVVGVLRALLTADTAQFDTSMRKAVATTQTTTKAITGLTGQVAKLTPQAERMVKAFGGDRLLIQANNLAAAVNKIGGASKLTDAELKRVNGTVTEAIAKYKALGQTAPSSLLDLERATRRMDSAAQGLNTRVVAFGSFVGTLAANAVRDVGSRLFDMAKSTFDAANNFLDLSKKTGLSVEALQRMKFVGDQIDTSLDTMADAAFKLSANLAGGGSSVEKAVKALGLSLSALQAMHPDQQFSTIVAALHDVDNEGQRNRLGIELFGRSFSTVAAAVAGNYADMAAAAKVATASQLEALSAQQQAWKEFVANLQTQTTAGLGSLVTWIKAWELAKGAPGASLGFGETIERFKRLRAELERGDIELPKATQHLLDLGAGAEESAKKLEDLAREFKRQMDVANATFESIQKIEKDMLDTRRSLEQKSAAEQERIAQETAKKQLETFLQLNQSIIGLDAERLRQLLQVNTPGSGPFKQVSREAGETIGQQMTKGIGEAFEQVPHFLTSSIIHSGSFINGLKAIGVDMADAVVEPLIKRFIARIAGARLIDAVAGGATGAVAGAGAAAASSVAAGGAGAAAAGAGGFGGTLAAFATNPFTIAAAGAAVGGFLLFKHFSGGSRANDARDKDLAQFSAFDTHRDASNPPGFYGLAALLAKYHKSDLFTPFISAGDPGSVKRTFAPIQAFMGSLGRNVKSYAMGGFVPPGVVQPAILHGPEWIVPQSKVNGSPMMSPTVHVTNQITVSAIDAKGVRDFLRSDTFAYEFGTVMERNLNFIATRTRKGLAY